MSESSITLRGFRGVVWSVEESEIPPNVAQDIQNVLTSESGLRPRSGWRSIASLSFSASYGFGFLRGRTTSSFVEEYLAILTIGGNTRPHSIDPLSGAITEIQEDGGAVNLSTGDYGIISFDGNAYAFRRSAAEGVYKHEIGNDDDFEPLDAGLPDDVTGLVSVSFTTDEDLSTESAGTPMAWTGFVGGDFTNNNSSTSPSSFGSISSGSLIVSCTAPASSSSQWGDVDLTLSLANIGTGTTDFSSASYLEFDLDFDPQQVSGFPNSFRVGFTGTYANPWYVRLTDATANTFEASASFTEVRTSTTAHKVTLRVEIPSGVDMAEYADTATIRIRCSSILCGSVDAGTTYPFDLTISAIRQADVDDTGSLGSITASSGKAKVRFGLANYDELRDQEATNVNPSQWYYIDDPKRWFTNAATPVFLGNYPTITMQHSGDPATHCRLYVQFEDENVWRLVSTVELTEETFEANYIESQFRAFSIRKVREENPIGAVACATRYKGWVVWGLPSGRSNLKHSKVGNPAALSRPDDDPEDLSIGETFTMAEDFNDSPVWIGEAGNALVILGHHGAYSQTGNYPSQMSPPAKLAQSKGIAGPNAAARFREIIGNPGVAYVTKSLDLFFITVVQTDPSGEYGFKLIETGLRIRNMIKEQLLQGGTLVPERLFVFADEIADTLWIAYENRAIVLQRPSIIDARRDFTYFSFAHTTGHTWRYWSSDPTYGIRALRSSGHFDELLRNSASSYADIGGATPDNSVAMPQPFWKSGEIFFETNVGRCKRLDCWREDQSEPASIVVSTERASRTVSFASGKRRGTGLWVDVSGYRITFNIQLPAGSSGVNQVVAHLAFSHTKRLKQ